MFSLKNTLDKVPDKPKIKVCWYCGLRKNSWYKNKRDCDDRVTPGSFAQGWVVNNHWFVWVYREIRGT